MPVTLNNEINYLVSGLERSGTSMLMQILNAGGAPVAFDSTRPSDLNNPKGYYELEGGKIINKLMDGTFPLKEFQGKFVKITAYGIKYLPKGYYKIIYSERNIDEILDSMEKMAGIKDPKRQETRDIFIKLNNMIKKTINEREDIDVLYVNYNDIISEPEIHIQKICKFLDLPSLNPENMLQSIDARLYRQRRK
jgi:hypothetical protein